MSTTNIFNTHHSDYDDTIDAVKTVRDTIEGSNRIKTGPRAEKYLPDPYGCGDKEIDQRTGLSERYGVYKARAEYDNFPGKTLSSYLGSINAIPPSVEEIPPEVDYLIDNSDGNSTPLTESIEMTQSNLLQVKFHGLLSDFNGLSDTDVAMTRLQAQEIGLLSTIKHYPRESIIDWEFSSANGKIQLTFVKLAESVSEIDKTTYNRVETENQLILSLDGNGQYNQRQVTKDKKGNEVVSEALYPENRGGKMDFIPFCFVIDQKSESFSIPRGLGLVYPISLKAISRYQVNADLKESLHEGASPTSYSSGWTEAKWNLYKKMTGRSSIALGVRAHNPLPEGSVFDFAQWNANDNGLFKYMDENQKEAKALGARFDTSDARDEAVGVAEIRSAEEQAAFINIQTSVESAYKKVVLWCFWFMATGTEDPEIDIKLNKDFTEIKLSAQEQAEIRNNVQFGIFDREEGLRQLQLGGVLTETATALLDRLERNGL
jgi:hypothetical protein